MTPSVRSSPCRRGIAVPLRVTNEIGLRVSPMGTPAAFGAGIRTGRASFAYRNAGTTREGGARG